MPNWLPDIIELSDFGGDYETYNNHLYGVFLNDFVHNIPIYDARRVFHDDRVLDDSGKCEAFFHLTTKDEKDAKGANIRVFDPRRSERLGWARAVIDNTNDVEILAWRNVRGKSERVILFLKNYDFVVVLKETKNKKQFIVITAYYVDYDHTKRKLLDEYSNSIN